MTTRERIDNLYASREEIDEGIKEIQTACTHANEKIGSHEFDGGRLHRSFVAPALSRQIIALINCADCGVFIRYESC